MHRAAPRPTIAIVGAGFSGVLTALNVLETPENHAKVHLIEGADRFGVGAAFGAEEPSHLLNVRAQNMSADPDDPDDFMLWLARRAGRAPDPAVFASRQDYGAYIQERLRRAAQTGRATDRLDLVQDTVAGIRAADGGFELRMGIGRSLLVDAAVLAIGNAPPSVAALPDPGFAADPAYIGAPWSADALDQVAMQDAVLLIGTGLTMVDVMASLEARGHVGPVTALSRHGLLPHAHQAAAPQRCAPWRRRPAEPHSQALRRFREAVDDGDWRTRFDSLRPVTQELWKQMDDIQRRRFLRHLRPWWDIHRHRLAPRMARRLEAWRATRLEVVAGRLRHVETRDGRVDVAWAPRGGGQARTLRVRWVVNCTGPEGDAQRLTSPLVRDLLASGLARPDPLRLGLDVDTGGRLIGEDGAVQPRLFAIGPIARGALWEVSAVPDIRVEARRLGRRLASLGGIDQPARRTG